MFAGRRFATVNWLERSAQNSNSPQLFEFPIKKNIADGKIKEIRFYNTAFAKEFAK